MVSPLNENDAIALDIISTYGPVCKSDAPQYGMPATTFQNHAKKLERLGIVKSFKLPQAGRGSPKTMYEVK